VVGQLGARFRTSDGEAAGQIEEAERKELKKSTVASVQRACDPFRERRERRCCTDGAAVTAGVLVFGLRPGWARLRLLLAARRPDPLPDVDARLLGQAQAGDARAFAEVVRHYEPRLRALAYRLLQDRDLTDDVLQEAFIRTFKSLGRFRGDSSFGTWIYRITYNACIDELRRRRRVMPLLGENAPEPIDVRSWPEKSAIERHDLAAAMASLPPDMRAAVMLVDVDGLDYAAAGRVLGVPPGTVGSRLNRARAILRVALGVSG